jgi:hypothetical protein
MTCRSHAAEHVYPSSEDETDGPLAQFRAWSRVASYALEITTAVLPALVDDLRRRLRDWDT